MATIKSYTNVEQSKVLAEILPLESTDMSYSFNFNSETYESSTVPYKDWIVPKYAQPDDGFGQIIPCWSLAALIEQLPSDIKGHELTIRKSYWQIEKTFAYELSYEENFEDYPPSILVSTSSIELIDACVEMILKLNELKML